MPKKVNVKDLEAAGRKVAHIIRHIGCMSEVEDGATKKDRHEAMRAEAFGNGFRDGFVAGVLFISGASKLDMLGVIDSPEIVMGAYARLLATDLTKFIDEDRGDK